MREYQVRICERLGVKFPGPTRQTRPGRTDGRSGHVCLTLIATDFSGAANFAMCQFPPPACPPGHSPEEGSARASALRHPFLATLMLVAPGDRAGRVPGRLDALDLLADLARGRAERVDANLAVRHAGAQRA
jgi:hypothetical protein